MNEEMRARTLFCFLLLLLSSSSVAWAQGGVPAEPIKVIDSQGRPRGGATVTICTSAGTGIPCTPLASVFTDAGLTNPAANPMTTDGLGNLPVIYAAPGVYKFTVTGVGITTQGQPFTATVAGTGGGDALRGQPNTFTAANTFTQQIVSTVSTGTAPFSIASTTVVPNLNAQLHSGKTAPSGNIVGDTDSQTLTNKTFDISANTLKSSTNTAAHYPRNNGSAYVDSTIQATDVPVFVASGASHAPGAVPDPGASAGTTRFLREDATWQTVSGGVSEATWSFGAVVANGQSGAACSAGAANTACVYTVFPSAHTLTRIVFNLQQAPSGCSPNAIVGLRDLTAASNVGTVTITQATGIVDSGALSAAMTAGHQFGLGLLTNAAGCTTQPVFSGMTMVYQ